MKNFKLICQKIFEYKNLLDENNDENNNLEIILKLKNIHGYLLLKINHLLNNNTDNNLDDLINNSTFIDISTLYSLINDLQLIITTNEEKYIKNNKLDTNIKHQKYDSIVNLFNTEQSNNNLSNILNNNNNNNNNVPKNETSDLSFENNESDTIGFINNGKKSIINNDQFNEHQENIIDNSKNVFLYFYMPNCIHCINFMKTWNEITKYDNENVKYLKINVNSNDHKQFKINELMKAYNINSFPSLVFLNNRNNNVNHFNNDRTLHNLKNFINYYK